MEQSDLFGTEKISKLLLRLAPPVMLAQLIQALYNIVDSLFVGRYSDSGLTALSIIYPLQLLMIAFAVGTGVGINTVMAAKLGIGDRETANEYAGVGTPLAAALWLLFAAVCWAIMPAYARMSTDSEAVIADVVTYGRIVCVFSFGLFLESTWTKVLQANGNMKTPMFAQILGAVTNILLDPLLIFGLKMGIAGAAVATVAGQMVAALIVMRKGFRRPPKPALFPHHIREIFRLGLPNILMQSAYTFYILGLNLILATFSDEAVTALGLYYKWQTFFFIPLGAMQTCIVPVISYNFAAHNIDRCKKTMLLCLGEDSIASAIAIVLVLLTGKYLLAIFNNDPQVIEIGYSRLLILFGSYIFSLTYEILSGYLRGFGISLVPAILTLFGVCGVRIIWINTVFPLHHTFRSIMLVYPISLATTAVLIFIALLIYRPSRRFAAHAAETPQT